MSIYCPFAEALGIETTKSILDIPEIEWEDPEAKAARSALSRRIQSERLEDGTHNFLNKDDAKRRSQKRLSDRTHPFLRPDFQKEIQSKRVKRGTHNFLGGQHQLKQLKEGKHPSQVIRTCPHCGKTGRGGGMMLKHFDNCKEKVT